VWLRHWGLACDPFLGTNSPYVSLPSHDEAVARLVYSIERGERFITLFAEAGLGKTTVVRRAMQETRNARRRFILVDAPLERAPLLGLLADGLGLPFREGSDPEQIWRSLVRAVRSAALEGSHLVVVIDGCDEGLAPATMKDLAALSAVGGSLGPAASLVQVGRRPSYQSPESGDGWALAIGLERLTHSHAATYVGAKLADAGCGDKVFTPRALTRLHAWSEGMPRRLDRLATLALMAGAVQGLEVVPPEVVDGVGDQIPWMQTPRPQQDEHACGPGGADRLASGGVDPRAVFC
jgi:general secretion pathway protein A